MPYKTPLPPPQKAPFTKKQALDAAEWISNSRRGDGPYPTELLAIVEYVLSRQDVPPVVLRDTALAGLVIVDHLASMLDIYRIKLIRLGRAPDLPAHQRTGQRSRPNGLTWRELAQALRVRTFQAAEQTYLRLLNQLDLGGNRYANPPVPGTRSDRAARVERRRVAASE